MVLLRFLERDYAGLSAADRDALEALLDEQDPDLAGWIWGGGVPPDKWRSLIERIRAGL